MAPLGWGPATAVAAAAVTALALYVTASIVRMYVFRRRDALNERFPFENTLKLFLERDRILEMCMEYFEASKKERGKKSFVLSVLGLPPFVMTQDIANITYILKTNFENFGKSGSFKPKMEGVLGGGIFNADGAQWYVHRKTSAHLFKLGQFKTTVLETFNQHLSTLTDVLRAKKGAAVDVQDLFHRLTLDSIAGIAFGVDLHTLRREDVAFAADFDYCTQCLNDSFVNPLWLVERYLTPKGWRYFLALRRINAFARDLIQARRELVAKEGALRSGRVDLLSLYLDKESFQDMAQDPGHDGRSLYMEPTDSNLRDVILNMVIAGRDTTAQALSWTFFRLCTRPEVQRRAREEVLGVLLAEQLEVHPEAASWTPEEALRRLRSHAAAERLVTYGTLQKLRYVDALLMETLRLHPSVPKEAKCAFADDVLPDGTEVRQGDIVSFLPWAMGRDADLWGPDCEDFKPERFLDQPKPSPFVFIAFQVRPLHMSPAAISPHRAMLRLQAGPRTCLGQNFAMLEMKASLARLLLEFEFALAQPSESVTYQSSLTLPVKGGLQIFARELP